MYHLPTWRRRSLLTIPQPTTRGKYQLFVFTFRQLSSFLWCLTMSVCVRSVACRCFMVYVSKKFTFSVQAEPQQSKMVQYSDSSGEEEGPRVVTSSPHSARGGKGHGSSPSRSEDNKAKVRFRYSRGTGAPLCQTAERDGRILFSSVNVWNTPSDVWSPRQLTMGEIQMKLKIITLLH